MKISIIASLIASASAVNLRSAVNAFLSSAASETLDARIMVKGLSRGELSDQEVNFIAAESLAAYNTVFGFDNAGQKFGDIQARGFSNLDEAAFINANVDILYYKDSFTGDMSLQHKAFEMDLCDRLRKSEFLTLSKAEGCTFDLMEQSGLNMEGPVASAYGHGKVTKAQLNLVGLKKELGQADKVLLNKVVEEAHKEAFSSTGLSISTFQSLDHLTVPSPEGWLHTCSLCCMYDDEDPRCPHFTDELTVVEALVSAAGNTDSVQHASAKIAHADFENFVCFKLRTSGVETFENVHDCSFNFVYNPAV